MVNGKDIAVFHEKEFWGNRVTEAPNNAMIEFQSGTVFLEFRHAGLRFFKDAAMHLVETVYVCCICCFQHLCAMGEFRKNDMFCMKNRMFDA